jgi:hypothetical protein
MGLVDFWVYVRERERERERETLQRNNLFLPLPVTCPGKKKMYSFKTTPF